MTNSNAVIDHLFAQACLVPSDINEHVSRMRELGSQCEHITEMGVRTGVSTVAWIAARPKKLVCFDIQRCTQVDRLESVAREIGIDFVFRMENVIQATIEETDLLFIDTLHTYDQLRQELTRHSAKARQYIVLHDTETFRTTGELPGTRGLWPAVEEHLASNPEWGLLERRINNNGLTVLVRVKS